MARKKNDPYEIQFIRCIRCMLYSAFGHFIQPIKSNVFTLVDQPDFSVRLKACAICNETCSHSEFYRNTSILRHNYKKSLIGLLVSYCFAIF